MRSVRIITMVGTSPFYLFCTVLIVYFSDFVISSNETKTIELNKLDPDIQFEKIYQYTVKQELLKKGYDLQLPINYKSTENDTLLLVPIEKFCNPNKEINICNHFQVLNENEPNNGIKIQIVDDIRTKMNNDSTIAFLLKLVNNQDIKIIYDETIILINIIVSRTDSGSSVSEYQGTSLIFEKPSYVINVAYGRKGVVYKFTACFSNASQHLDRKCNDQVNVTYTFAHNTSQCTNYLNCLLNHLYIDNKSGNLTINSVINEGFYEFVIEAKYNGEEGYKAAQTTVTLFVDNVAVCEKDDVNFQIAYRKIYIDENTISVVYKNTNFNQNCTWELAKCHPDAVMRNIEINNGEIKIKEGLDRESAIFYDDPNVFLKLSCQNKSYENDAIQFPQWFEYMPYDPHSTVIQIVINDVNDNPPTFPEKHIVIGYPVAQVALDVSPEHLVQVKATDNDFGENANITYSLKSNDGDDFLIDPMTGIIYCNHLVDSGDVVKEFTVIANNSVKDPNGEDMTCELLVTVKYLTYEHIIKVNTKFNVEEYIEILERQLSDITGWKISSLSNKIINGEVDGGGVKLERTMIVYGIDNKSLVHGSDLEKSVETAYRN
ncbi:uncharacterized protein LOC126905541 isoform X2 [Daktulosphaira vitifoliae]|uniref:uncharacterized protein LOC126905541 isoform X2 n=1 Tax=Daktulosphaira vitifoliae TaxID=58002 RepID=UPI0021AA95AE|nr:uncharacterized protein LOC126905541 isoform X2 [Daktulosphaira vitifoliae]